MNPFSRGLSVLFGFLAVLMGASAFVTGVITTVMDIGNDGPIVKDIPYITDGQINPANEGKMVAVQGTLEGELPLVDPLTEAKLPTVVAVRHAEVYKDVSDTDERTRFDWEEQKLHKEDKINSDEPRSSVLVSKTNIGAYNLDPELLRDVPAKKPFGDVVGSTDKPQPNDIRYKYTVLDPKDPMNYTVFGIQRGNTIVDNPKLAMPGGYKGHISAQKAMWIHKGNVFKTYVGAFVLSALFVVLGVFWIKNGTQKRAKKAETPGSGPTSETPQKQPGVEEGKEPKEDFLLTDRESDYGTKAGTHPTHSEQPFEPEPFNVVNNPPVFSPPPKQPPHKTTGRGPIRRH